MRQFNNGKTNCATKICFLSIRNAQNKNVKFEEKENNFIYLLTVLNMLKKNIILVILLIYASRYTLNTTYFYTHDCD